MNEPAVASARLRACSSNQKKGSADRVVCGDKLKLTWQGGGEKVEPGLVVNALADFVFALFQLQRVF